MENFSPRYLKLVLENIEYILRKMIPSINSKPDLLAVMELVQMSILLEHDLRHGDYKEETLLLFNKVISNKKLSDFYINLA